MCGKFSIAEHVLYRDVQRTYTTSLTQVSHHVFVPLTTRYTRVIAVVGFNPNKKYLVSPEQRKDLLQKMVATTSATNIEVEGRQAKKWFLKNPLISDI